jgi:hypothetical protein
MKFSFVIVFSVVTFFSTAAFAETTQQSSNRWNWYLALGKAAFDEEKAQQEFIEDSAWSIRIAGGYQKSSLLFGFGLSGFFYDDNKQFSQTVQDQYGTVSTADSSADSVNLFGEMGYRFSLTDQFYFDFLGGYEQVLSSKRSISNCSDCYDENIDIKSGLYLLPRLQYKLESGFNFALSYQQNFTGDVKNVVLFSIGFDQP